MTPIFATLLDRVDERIALRKAGRTVANYVFPRHWSFLLGEVAMFSFGFLVLTGLFLTMFYRPSIEPVTYTGEAVLYQGRELPAAFESIVRLSHDVPGGLFIRRIHRAAAQVFVGVIVLHLLRVLWTGAFRKPRDLNYHVGVVLLLLVLATGYSGHNLPFDVLSGTSLRILYSFLLAVPFVGESVAQFAFGGEFPTGQIIPRLFIFHVLVLPVLIAGGILTHVALVVRQTHTQVPRPGVDAARTEIGTPLWPNQFGQSASLAIALAGLLALAAVAVPWSDVDLHGPYLIAQASNASQPDWYLFWVEGALRLYPASELHVLGTVIAGPFVAGVLFPLLLMIALLAYPSIERRVTGDVVHEHHALQRGLDVPFRAGFVAGLFTFLLVLNVAAGHDVVARLTRLPIETVTWLLRALLVLGPLTVAALAVRAARRGP